MCDLPLTLSASKWSIACRGLNVAVTGHHLGLLRHSPVHLSRRSALTRRRCSFLTPCPLNRSSMPSLCLACRAITRWPSNAGSPPAAQLPATPHRRCQHPSRLFGPPPHHSQCRGRRRRRRQRRLCLRQHMQQQQQLAL